MFYLKHPLHGYKHAYTIKEMEDDKKNGWSEYKPESENKIAKNTEAGNVTEASEEVPQVNIAESQKRRGRPPKVENADSE